MHTNPSPDGTELFRVDLRGVVEILSHHLYSSPKVFVRELLQNARDALTARAGLDDRAARGGPGGIRVVVEDGTIVVEDDGIGLTADEMRDLLATIGASSKRDDLVRVQQDFLGRFGIGLLSCFLIADSVDVLSRSARTPHAPTMRWVGHSDGTYVITEAPAPLPQPGTRVRIRPRREEKAWANSRRLTRIAREFARYLDVPIEVADAGGPATRVSMAVPPSDLDADAAARLCQESFGFDPLTTLHIDLPLLGVRGIAYVTPSGETSARRAGDLVHSRGMLVSADNTQLAPSWAYFVRMIIDAGTLPLTASRESLQDTKLTREAAEAIGAEIQAHVDALSRTHPDTFRRFVAAHGTGLRAMALDDPAMFGFCYDHVAFRTSRGPRTLRELIAGTDTEPAAPVLHQVFSPGQFRALAPLAAVQGLVLVDASHVHEPQILARLAESDTGIEVRHLDLERLVEAAAPVTDRQLAATIERTAADVLPDHDVEVVDLRVATVPAVELRADDEWASDGPGAGGSEAAGSWGSVFSGMAASWTPRGPRLVLNIASPVTRALAGPLDSGTATHAVRALHVLGRLHTGGPLSDDDHTVLGESLGVLVLAAAAPGAATDERVNP